MDYTKLSDIKDRYKDYKEIFDSGDLERSADILEEMLQRIEEASGERRAGQFENDTFVKKSDMDGRPIYISLNHVMEYYVYACYFEPEADVKCTEIPVGEYYRTYGELCLRLSKFHRAEDAYRKAICWNPVDLDSYLGLAECYKNLNMLSRYLDITRQAYRFCCTRATMARYYRNMGFYFVAKYQTEAARVCYTYSNIYYKTENADNELKYLEDALKEETPEYSIRDMQKILEEQDVEPGPDSKTIGIIYRVGELMMEDKDYALARDCFSIVYDITQEGRLKTLLDELDKDIMNSDN